MKHESVLQSHLTSTPYFTANFLNRWVENSDFGWNTKAQFSKFPSFAAMFALAHLEYSHYGFRARPICLGCSRLWGGAVEKEAEPQLLQVGIDMWRKAEIMCVRFCVHVCIFILYLSLKNCDLFCLCVCVCVCAQLAPVAQNTLSYDASASLPEPTLHKDDLDSILGDVSHI